jgi:hypothetical protein
MKHIKLFEAFEDKSILDSDFIVDTLNDIKKEAFSGKTRHDQIEFKWDPKNLQLTIKVKPEEAYSRSGLSKERAEEDLENDMPMFSERISRMLSEATKRIQEEGISLESGDDTSWGRTGFRYIRRTNFSDEKELLYQLLVSK